MWHFEGQIQGSYVYHNWQGYYYHCSFTTDHTCYFKCRLFRRGCRGRAVLYDQGDLIEYGWHNHGRDFRVPAVMELRRAILQTTRTFPSLNFRQIVQQERRRFPVRIQSEVTVNGMRHSMRRVRMERYPPRMPQTMNDLVDMLNSQQFRFITDTEGGDDNLFATPILDPEGNTHVVLISERMRGYLNLCTWMFCDGHFASRPVSPPMAQIFNIATSWQHHALYMGSIFMTSRTEIAYQSVFECLLQLCPTFNPDCLSCDFERAMQQAASNVFPESLIVGCFWHFARAVVKKAQKLGLGMWILRSRRFRRHLRMCCCLALFPVDLAPIALVEIGLDILESSGWFVYTQFYPLLQYLQNRWLEDPLRRETMCVFGSEHRTNNVVECLNRYMRAEVGAHHPNIYALFEGLSRLEAYSFAAITALEEGGRPSRVRRTEALWNDERLRVLGRTLEEQPFGQRHAVMSFLWYGSNSFRAAFNDLIGFEEE